MMELKQGDSVRSKSKSDLGVGRVKSVEILAGTSQATVHFGLHPEILPVEDLERVLSPWDRYKERSSWSPVSQFDLRTQAKFLQVINAQTGALTGTRVDILPHQMLVTHKVVTSSPIRWLVADDVGLGKTVEAGLILTALRTQGRGSRALIVVPAGLTEQWKEEMREKFGIKFRVLSPIDVREAVKEPEDTWRDMPLVIASMDRLKPERVRQTLKDTAWDLVIFDEAHKLSAYESGERADRYRLAEILAGSQACVRAMVFLTATPHQGKRDKFFYLLRLLRPDIFRSLEAFDGTLHRLPEMVIRNQKRQVTDAHRNKLFPVAPAAKRISVELSKAEQAFLTDLHDYLRQGYGLAESGGEQRAIGFVMTTFQKLASSSKAAIEAALRKRHEALVGVVGATTQLSAPRRADKEDQDVRTREEDLADATSHLHAPAFFPSEAERLRRLLRRLEGYQHESKFAEFMKGIASCLKGHTGEKVLVFTEYRRTQDFLVTELGSRYGPERVAQIHGGMPLEEKIRNAAAFNAGSAQFLVSTEAGSEGINLQEACHILFNYDLPWNPMRIHQRVGRLYRYGQKQPVHVYQFRQVGAGEASIDDRIHEVLEECIRSVEDTLKKVNPEEHPENIREYLLGELIERGFDWDAVHRRAVLTGNVSESADALRRELEKVQGAEESFSRLLAGVPGFRLGDYEAIKPEATMEHVQAFVTSFLAQERGGRIEPIAGEPECWTVKVPAKVRRNTKANERYPCVTFSRRCHQRGNGAEFLGFGHPLLDAIVGYCLGPSVEGSACGRTVKSREWRGIEGLQFNYVVSLRQDAALRQEYIAVFVDKEGKVQAHIGPALRLLPSQDTLSPKARFLTHGFEDRAKEIAHEWVDQAGAKALRAFKRQHPAATVGIELLNVAAVRFV